MGLFDKKFCDVCGDKIGMLGNRKLEDGNLCKTCAAKLSPFFSERRSSTVAEIKEQLDYREENKAAVAAFHTTRTLGKRTKVLVDEDAGVFMVTSASNLADANPDVLSLSDITGCEIQLDEDKRELYQEVRGADGKTQRQSYTPRRYEYSYDFNIIIHINHRYFNEIKFQLNDSGVHIDYREGPAPVGGFLGGMMGRPRPPMGQANPAAARAAAATGRPMAGAPMGRLLEGSTTPPPLEVRLSNPTYAEYEAMAEEIKAVLLQVRQEIRDSAAAAAAPKQKVACPYCGAATFPDANGCCEFCGSPLNG